MSVLRVKWLQPVIHTSNVLNLDAFRLLQYHSSVVIGTRKNKILVLGGWKPERHNHAFIYNVDTGRVCNVHVPSASVRLSDRWSDTTLDVPGISGHKICCLDSTCLRFLVGTGEVGSNQFSSSMFVLDLTTRPYSWSYFSSSGSWEIPRQIEGYSWDVHEGKLYMFGGGGAHSFTNAFHCFDFATSTWEKFFGGGRKEFRPFPVFYHATLLHDDQLYVFGGSKFSRKSEEMESDRIYVFDLATREWIRPIPFPNGIFGDLGFTGGSVVKYGSLILLLGGFENSEIRAYDLETKEWYWGDRVAVEGSGPEHFECATVDVVRGKIVCIGGNSNRMIVRNFGVYHLEVLGLQSPDEGGESQHQEEEEENEKEGG